MSRARSVADLGNQNVLDLNVNDGTLKVGAGVTIENTGEVQFAGIVTAATVQIGAATTLHSTGLDLGAGNINSHNITSTGNLSVDGNMTVGGLLTYEDVASVDSVGIITAQAGIVIGTGTSISSPASNVLTLGTNNEERLRITSGGSVGIGTAVPEANLHIHAPNSGLSVIRLSGSAANQITYDIRQGIPGVNNSGFSIRDITNSENKFNITHTGDVNVLTGHLQAEDLKIGLINNVYPIIQRAVQSSGSQNLSITGGSGYTENTTSDHSLVDAREGAMIQLGAGDPTSDPYGGYIKYFAHGSTSPHSSGVGNAHVFYTRSAANTNTERLRITSGGLVGINEDNPTALLHVNYTGSQTTTSYKTASHIRLDGTSGADTMSGIGFGDANSGGNDYYPSAWMGTQVSSWSQYVKHDLVFATRDVDTNTEPEERLRIDSNGWITQQNDLRYTQLGYFQTGTSIQNATNNPALAGTLHYGYGYQEGFSVSGGNWGTPYPDLVIGYHTGLRLGGYFAYGGCRFYADHPSASTSVILGIGDGNANVYVTNNLSKGGGTFRIAHPHPSKKYTHDLQHSFIEGPQCDNLYRGRVDLVDGTASINIDIVSNMTDGTFVLLNRDIQCFTSNETGWDPVKGSVSGNILTITSQNNSSTDTISWMVIGERQDDKIKSPDMDMTDSDGKLIVEPLTIEQSHM